ncbi:MAG TPA: FecR domain-containing protein [Chitinophagaceae bacterium]|nr:FecR domain-containing protein [Chitinophagaceae bacterium]
MADHIHDMIEDVLVKYLTGEATAEEAALVEQWLHQNEANSRYYEGLAKVWHESVKLAPNMQVDEEDAWQKFKKRVDQPSAHVISRMRRTAKPFTRGIRIAAAIFFIAVAGIIIYLFTARPGDKLPAQFAISTLENTATDTLGDGSVVTLNKYSSITFPGKFKKDKREVHLTGEAFFKVSPNKSKPFVIYVNNVTITVVGTSFNVRSINGKTEVIVETGIVRVANKNHSVQLMPKQKVIADSVQAPAKDTAADNLYNYYRSREFVCNNTPLKRLVEILNEAYDNRISIENKALENLPITTVFKEEPLENIIKVITETFGIKAAESNGKYILR